jgi:hypothetical protein
VHRLIHAPLVFGFAATTLLLARSHQRETNQGSLHRSSFYATDLFADYAQNADLNSTAPQP